MGTNYYAHKNTCECCNRPENILHIGKSSCDWTFSFRGYEDYEDDDSGQRCNVNIQSYKDWLELLANEKDVHIYNEYGELVLLEDFKSMVELKQEDGEYNHAKLVLEDDPSMLGPTGYVSEEYKSRCWLDDEGYSFTNWEFC